MKTFNHVLTTWIISVLFMLVIATGYAYYQSGMEAMTLIGAFNILFYSVLGSIPSLVISWPLLILILQSPYLPGEKLFLWCLVTEVAILLNILIPLLLFFPDMIEANIFLLFWPAYLAVILAVLVRAKQFLSLIITIQHENKLV